MLTLSVCAVQDCILETDEAKSGPNAQNVTSGAMKSFRVRATGKLFFAFSATLNKCSGLFTLTTMFGKTYLYQ